MKEEVLENLSDHLAIRPTEIIRFYCHRSVILSWHIDISKYNLFIHNGL